VPFKPLRVSKAALPPAHKVPVREAAQQLPVRVEPAAVVEVADGAQRRKDRLQGLPRGSPMESPI
jgi:hypothetical protein